MKNISEYEAKFNKALGKLSTATNLVDTYRKSLAEYSTLLEDTEKAQAFLQQIAKETQEQLKYHITDIVQLALDTCFPDEYEFNINFEIKRGRTEAELVFTKDGRNIDPMDASGGGAVDLAAFALRISAWALGRTRNTIILDEPFRFLSKDLQPRAGEIMQKLSKHLHIQFIMVTHSDAIVEYADAVFEVNKVDGISKAIKVKGANE